MEDDYEYNYSEEEDEYEYNYSEDGDISIASGSGDDMESLEMETADSEMAGTSEHKRQKRKSRSSSTGHIRDCPMRDNDSAIHMKDSKDLIPMMKSRVEEITDVLNIPPSAAGPLLRNHKWIKERLFEEYTVDDVRVQKKAGVFARCEKYHCKKITAPAGAMTTRKSQQQQQLQQHTCDICFDDELKESDMLGMPCGHEFCLVCWAGYVRSKIADGPTCIMATCPQSGCKELMTEEEVRIAAPHLLSKYQSYQLRNFVDLNGTSRWCPGPGCERVAALNSTSGLFNDSDSMIAHCDECATRFCIKCGEEPHSPLTCRSLESWKEKCENESETANWILANTKPCPKCRSRIEKNQGCNHMTCQQCKYEFCWICGGDWSLHGANTGGYYNCNKFNEDEKDKDDQSDAAKAKRELDRYLHYYSRYHAHAEAQKFAKRQLQETEKRMIKLQESRDNSTWTDVEFLKTANEQLVECRRVLKFTYTYAYYLTMPGKTPPATDSSLKEDKKSGSSTSNNGSKKAKSKTDEEESITPDPATIERTMQKDRFEHHQEMLERFTENLSELVEKSIEDIHREMVVNQTRVVGKFMKNMLEYVDNDMEDQYQ